MIRWKESKSLDILDDLLIDGFSLSTRRRDLWMDVLDMVTTSDEEMNELKWSCVSGKGYIIYLEGLERND